MTTPPQQKDRMDGWNLGEEVSNTSSLFGNIKGERRKKEGKWLWERDDGRWRGAEGSTRQEDMREGGKVESVEGKTDMITKETARKIPRWGERDSRVWSRQRGKRVWGEGRKEVGGQREGEGEEEYRMNANREPKLSSELYPSQAEEQQSQTHFLSPWP